MMISRITPIGTVELTQRNFYKMILKFVSIFLSNDCLNWDIFVGHHVVTVLVCEDR